MDSQSNRVVAKSVCRSWLIGTLTIVFLSGCSVCGTHIVEAPFGGPFLAKTSGWSGFRKPGQAEQAKLEMLEEYEPGKVPVVFIHGLLSAPGTWREMIHALRTSPVISERFQFWVFHYPTGASYLQSAADLRRELHQTVAHLDPFQQDHALNNLILVGHSMGGIISKLQVTHSDDQIWRSVSNRPFSEFNADDSTLAQVQKAMFFEPVPFVRRVIFIATPHHGSQWTERSVGRLGRRLVGFPKPVQQSYQQLVAANLSLLNPTIESRLPTSVDHLDPDNAILQATTRLRFVTNVRLHSIIGTGHKLPDDSDGDGVVSLQSAHIANVVSESTIPAKHTLIHRDPDTIQIVEAALLEHLSN
tara:strand:+ start:18707 stop:19783 length:1077 start_codon:yes stop_codon:yes gene_type:complete